MQSIPSVSYGAAPLSSFFEKIIDKKVNQLALTYVEKFVDILCSFFSRAYSQRLIFRFIEANALQQKAKEAAKRVHNFRDGFSLFDQTTARRVKIETFSTEGCEKSFEGATKEQMLVVDRDEVVIDGKPVYFTTPAGLEAGLFSTKNGTKKVRVFNDKDSPDIVLIYEYRTNGELKAWFVLTRKIIQFWEKIGSSTPGKAYKYVRDGLVAQQIPIQHYSGTTHVNLSDTEMGLDMEISKNAKKNKDNNLIPNIFTVFHYLALKEEFAEYES